MAAKSVNLLAEASNASLALQIPATQSADALATSHVKNISADPKNVAYHHTDSAQSVDPARNTSHEGG